MTPERIAELTEQLGPRGRFARKDPSLLAVARELLRAVRETEELARESERLPDGRQR